MNYGKEGGGSVEMRFPDQRDQRKVSNLGLLFGKCLPEFSTHPHQNMRHEMSYCLSWNHFKSI